MAGQAPSRRELLQALTLAGFASTFSGFSRWSYALGEEMGMHHPQDAVMPRARASYTPQFFSPEEYRLIEVLVDLILPSTKDSLQQVQPGAKEAGVAEFIDFMVFSDHSLELPFRDGLAWLNHASKPAAGFVALSAEQQNGLLERLAYKAKHRKNEEAGQQFFRLIRKYTVMGFYTSQVGLVALDFPGLKFYGASPGCTHADNPEHVGL
jgi:gluconate 2-dehydrogenase gamma chain